MLKKYCGIKYASQIERYAIFPQILTKYLHVRSQAVQITAMRYISGKHIKWCM